MPRRNPEQSKQLIEEQMSILDDQNLPRGAKTAAKNILRQKGFAEAVCWGLHQILRPILTLQTSFSLAISALERHLVQPKLLPTTRDMLHSFVRPGHDQTNRHELGSDHGIRQSQWYDREHNLDI